MKVDSDKLQTITIQLLRLSILVAIAGAIWKGRWQILFVASLILVLTYLPTFFEKKYRINLPIEFELVVILFLYGSLFLGEIHSYYARFWWWDVALHTSSGVALGFAGFIILYVLYRNERIQAKPIWIAVFAFSFGVAMGAVWEIFEFTMDQVFGTGMQKSGLIDTMWDLIVDSLGALLTSAVGYFYIQGRNIPLFTRLLQKFSKENPQMFKDGPVR